MDQPLIITSYPDGQYSCTCSDGSCTIDEDEDIMGPKLVKAKPAQRSGGRFDGHWIVTDAGLRFVIDRSWLETK